MSRLGLLCLALALPPAAAAAETRCGWLFNPTPANWWLIDADGEWTLSLQGTGDGGSGFYDVDWDEPAPGQWVETNGHYGFGCACFEGAVDRRTGWAVVVTAVTPLPLASCDADPALPPRGG